MQVCAWQVREVLSSAGGDGEGGGDGGGGLTQPECEAELWGVGDIQRFLSILLFPTIQISAKTIANIIEPASGACGTTWEGGSGRRESSEVQHGDWRGGFCLLIHNFRQTRWQKLQLQHGNCRRGSSLILVPDSNPGFESDSWFQCSRLSLMPRSHARRFQIGMILMFNRNPHVFFLFCSCFWSFVLWHVHEFNGWYSIQWNHWFGFASLFLCLCLLGLT